MITPILETSRLTLRPLRIEDAPEVYNNWTSDPEVAKYVCWAVHESLDVTIQYLTEEVNNVSNEHYYNWGFVLKETGELIGAGGVCLSKVHDCYCLGYNIMKKYWRKGITSEATQRIMDFAKDDLAIREIFCDHCIDNPASGAVMQKVGFQYIGEGTYTSYDKQRIFQSKQYKWKAT